MSRDRPRSPTIAAPKTFRVGDWTADPLANRLVRGTAEAHLEPRAMQVLVALAEQPGELVAKETLLDTVWDGRFVTDDVLTGAVSQLRKALGDDARSPRYVQTVPRRGYRLVASCSEAEAPPILGAEIEPSERLRGKAAAEARSGWRTPLAALVALTAAAVLLAVARWAPRHDREPLIAEEGSPDAVSEYLDGKRRMRERSLESIGRAQRHFRRALEIDPKFARAWAGLAESHLWAIEAGQHAPDSLEAMAEAAGEALALDPELPEAMVCKALYDLWQSWDFEAADRAFQAAVEAGPDLALAHGWYAIYLASAGRFAEARGHMLEAAGLDPEHSLGGIEQLRFAAGERLEAIAGLRQLAAERPGDARIRWLLFEMLWAEGRGDEAYEELRGAVVATGGQARLEMLDAAYSRGGLDAVFRFELEVSQAAAERGMPISPVYLARLAAVLGEVDAAFEYLEHARRVRDPELLLVRLRPMLDPLREDPRFEELLRTIGLSPES